LTVFARLEALGAARCLLWSDVASGLRAVAVIDDLRRGPAAGGIRTRRYASLDEAVEDAAALARAMTLKCALSGLRAGGCKIVVLDHPSLDRPRAFARLGQLIEELGGLIRTAGDLGTTRADLEAAAAGCRYVHVDEGGLSEAVARGLIRCIEACAAHRGIDWPLRVAVQGAGNIGAAVTRALKATGAEVMVADVDAARAEAVGRALGVEVVTPETVLRADVDVVAPCAMGGVIDEVAVEALRAWAVVPGANNVLVDPLLAGRLRDRGILFIPDVLSSAGAVVEGIGRTVMDLADRTPLIDALGATAGQILTRSDETGRSTVEIALALAEERLG
jgi:leucine dehydrogenase